MCIFENPELHRDILAFGSVVHRDEPAPLTALEIFICRPIVTMFVERLQRMKIPEYPSLEQATDWFATDITNALPAPRVNVLIELLAQIVGDFRSKHGLGGEKDGLEALFGGLSLEEKTSGREGDAMKE